MYLRARNFITHLTIVTNFGASHGATALKDSPSEKRVIKHLERAIKDKLFKAGLDTGGRQIEVKFITTSIPSEVFGGKEDGGEGVTDESMTSEEARQFQGMIYNLMVSFFSIFILFTADPATN